MTHWKDQLQVALDERASNHALRELRTVDKCGRIIECDGQRLLNLASNDYLALACDPRIANAVCKAAVQFGVGSGSSRLIAGNLAVHRQLEQRFSRWLGVESSLLLPTGYLANLAALTTLAGEQDVVVLDKLCHASLIDASRMSGATVRVFPHKNYEKLDQLLGRYPDARRRVIVTESVFSMDGDCADLPALCRVRDQHDAVLLVDEAHAVGWMGATGSGLAEEQGVRQQIDITVSTMGKAMGSVGGIISGPDVFIQSIVNLARPFIFATGAPPTQAAAILAALDVIEQEPKRRDRLREICTGFRQQMIAKGWGLEANVTPIVPLIVGENQAAIALSEHLRNRGSFAPAIRPPTVAPGSSRVRVSLRCDLTDDDLEGLVQAIGSPSL